MHPLWLVCVTVRLSIIFIIRYLYKFRKNKLYKLLPAIILFFGLDFIRKGIWGSNNEIQIAKVFWHETRLVHGMLLIFASYYLYKDNLNMNSIILFTDLLFSFTYRFVNQV